MIGYKVFLSGTTVVIQDYATGKDLYRFAQGQMELRRNAQFGAVAADLIAVQSGQIWASALNARFFDALGVAYTAIGDFDALAAALNTILQMPTGSGSGSGVTRTAITSVETTSGTVAAGAIAVQFSADAAFAGTVNGAALAAYGLLGFAVDAPDTLAAIPYTISAGSLRIDKLV